MMIRNEKIIQEITIEQALEIIETREPLGLFLTKKCMDYLLGYDI